MNRRHVVSVYCDWKVISVLQLKSQMVSFYLAIPLEAPKKRQDRWEVFTNVSHQCKALLSKSNNFHLSCFTSMYFSFLHYSFVSAIVESLNCKLQIFDDPFYTEYLDWVILKQRKSSYSTNYMFCKTPCNSLHYCLCLLEIIS